MSAIKVDRAKVVAFRRGMSHSDIFNRCSKNWFLKDMTFINNFGLHLRTCGSLDQHQGWMAESHYSETRRRRSCLS